MLARGGGESQDASFRKAGENWWPQELPQYDEIEEWTRRLAEGGNQDSGCLESWAVNAGTVPYLRRRDLDFFSPGSIFSKRHWYFSRRWKHSMVTKTIHLTTVGRVQDFTSAMGEFDFEVDLSSGRYTVNGKSIMGG